MSNIIEYVKNNADQTFSERPLTSVDSLILSQLSYLFFDDILSESIKFETALQDILNSDNCTNLYNFIRVPEQNKELLLAAANSKRFSQIKLGYYINDFDIDAEKQFSAVTFKLDKKLYYVAYRGTDNSFIGWKEDFNMSFMPAVPAQTDAVDYFNKLANKLPRASFILGGHSKGGNLAVYTGVFCEEKYQKKIINIYNHDGPGFRDDVLNHTSLDRIKHLINKTMPQSSIIGMLMEQYEPYKVIYSNGIAIMQHDPFTWEIKKQDFKYADGITDSSKRTGAVIKNWLYSNDEQTRKIFIDALFSLVQKTNASSFQELLADIKGNAPIILDTIKTADPNIRKTVSRTLYQLLTIIASELKEITAGRISDIQIPKPKFIRRDERTSLLSSLKGK